MFVVSMPNFATSAALVETATKCFATACSSPGARGAGVGHGLQRREGLRRDDEQCLGGVEVAGGLGEVGTVDVRDEAESQAAVAVGFQGLVGHHRAEVGSADADVDVVADGLAGVPLPLAAAHPVGEIG